MDNEDLKRLIDSAPPMTPEQKERQRKSFVYGNTKLSNDVVTREQVDQMGMSNLECLWCGSSLVKATETADSGSSVIYACEREDCRAKGLRLPEHLAVNPYPAEIELWEIEIEFVDSNGHSHEVDAAWLGLFVSKELAERVAIEEFGFKEQVAFTWDVKPVIFVLRGGKS